MNRLALPNIRRSFLFPQLKECIEVEVKDRIKSVKEESKLRQRIRAGGTGEAKGTKVNC